MLGPSLRAISAATEGKNIASVLGFLIDDGCHRLGLLSIFLWRSEILMRDDHGCHVERGCETTFSGAPCIHGGEKLLFSA